MMTQANKEEDEFRIDPQINIDFNSFYTFDFNYYTVVYAIHTLTYLISIGK